MRALVRALVILTTSLSATASAIEPPPLRCGTPDVREARRLLDGPTPPAPTDAFLDTDHFRLHYATSGVDMIAGWPDPAFRDSLAVYLETAYTIFRDEPAVALREPYGGGPIGPSGRALIEVYVVWMDEYYGLAHAWGPAGGGCPYTGFTSITINNHFDRGELFQEGRLIAAHELFHAFQNATDAVQGPFIDESTASWSERRVWPDDRVPGWELRMLREPFLPVWDTSDFYRPYGGWMFWQFLDAVLDGDARSPAAEVWWRLCDRPWMTALGELVGDSGRELDDVLHEFAVWNHYINRLDDGRHYAHGDEIAYSVSKQGDQYVYPVLDRRVDPDRIARWGGTNYLRFQGRATREELRIVLAGDPSLTTRRVTPICTTVPGTHVQLPTRMPDATGRIEVRIDDWNLYDIVTLVLTNPESPGGLPSSALDYSYSAWEEGDPAIDIPWSVSTPTLAYSPNPARAGTFVRFDVTDGSVPTRLAILDVSGRRVRLVVDGTIPAGTHNRIWDGRDSSGRPVADGTYLMVLRNGAKQAVRKLTVLR